MTPSAPPPADVRSDFARLVTLPTRWGDNDVYSHANNVVYYAWFDTVINRNLIETGGLDIFAGSVIGIVVESNCRFLRPVGFPDSLELGLRVAHLGNSSVRHEIGVFVQGSESLCALGSVVHVFVDRETRRPVSVPPGLRAALESLQGTRRSRRDLSDPMT